MQKHSELLNTLLKYGVAALLLAVPLYPKFPFLQVPGTYVSIRLEDFLILAVTLLFLLSVFPNIKDVVKGKIERAIVIYLGIGFVSLLSAIFLTKSIVPHIGFLHLARRLEYFTPFFIGLFIFKNNKSDLLEFFIKLLISVVLIVFVYGFGQKYFAWPVIVTQNMEYSKGIALRWIPGSHINSTFAGHYDLATFLVMILPIFICLLVLLKDVKARVILSVTILSGYWLMANAVSRISIASFLGATVISLILVKKYKALPIFLLVSIIIFGFSSDLRARYERIIDVLERRIVNINGLSFFPRSYFAYAADDTGVLNPKAIGIPSPTPTPVPVFEDRSTSIRLNVEWPRSLRAFAKNPILGTGYSSITLATDNDYLRMLGETGLLGFLAFSLIFLRIAKPIIASLPIDERRKDVEKAFLAGFIGALAGIFLNAVFIDIFESSKFAILFWLMVGFSVSLMRKKNYE